jgi:hypothetical protein
MNMQDLFSFDKMITPVVIKFFYVLLMVFAVIGGIVQLPSNPIQGILTILLGPLVIRIYAEFIMIMFNLYGAVDEIRDMMKSKK